jgi:hypothetical protein
MTNLSTLKYVIKTLEFTTFAPQALQIPQKANLHYCSNITYGSWEKPEEHIRIVRRMNIEESSVGMDTSEIGHSGQILCLFDLSSCDVRSHNQSVRWISILRENIRN